jgi:hypothetical protein
LLADRSNAGIALVNADNLQFIGTYSAAAPGAPAAKFAGTVCTAGGTVVPCSTTVAVNNNISGPNGVTSHGIWVYAGDGDSTLKVIDLRQAPPNGIVQSVHTLFGTMRVDEMALTLDGNLLLATSNADDPPFATLFLANGDSLGQSDVIEIIAAEVDPAILPHGFGLSLEQPTWEPSTQRFYTSIPIIANNPPGCNFDASAGPITCDGGVLVFDPNHVTPEQCDGGLEPGIVCVLGAFDPTTNTGVISLHPANRNATLPNGPGGCGPNGITVKTNPNGSHTLLLGCTPGNNPFDTTTQTMNPNNRNFEDTANITGSDEVWFNPSIYAPSRFIGDNRYYLGASKSYTLTPVCTPILPPSPKFCAVLGVVGGDGILIETIPQSSNSHSVAADAARNLIYVPQVAPASVVGPGGDTTTVGQQLCGGTDGCVVVYGSPGPHPPAD